MSNHPRATIPATEVRSMMSSHFHQEYRISVALPYSYASQPEKTFPTVYLLDANVYFGMVTELSRIMAVNDELPEAIVVGIGYPMDEPIQDVFKPILILRIRDFMPVVDSAWEAELETSWRQRVATGGAHDFLSFIEKELMPLIEQDYRAAPEYRVLMGHSLGGLFTLYTMFHRTDLFKGYVAASPSLQRGDGVTFNYESTFAEQHNTLPIRLYLGIGEKEQDGRYPNVSDVLRLAGLLESRQHKGLVLTKHVIPNCGHSATTAPSFQAGLQAVLV